ncbi:MAG: histidine phosphatase family protein [Gammaproteobacteria bacterium]|nr:histidine phosphatase family protein [Gammaproteobacteria bacterium]
MFNRRWPIIGKLLRSVVATLLAALLLIAPAGAEQATLLTGKVLVDAMRAGGLNLYFRHAATVWSQSDDLRRQDDWLSCDPERMRQLSDDGRADAIAIGDAMRELGIPVSQVLASPYCRTRETAELMRLGAISHSTDVMNLRAAQYFGSRAAITATAQRLLASKPNSGGNRVIVAHGNVAREATPYYPAEGEGLVFRPDGDVNFTLIGRIEPRQWAQLLAAAAD